MHAEQRLPMKFHEARFAGGVDETKSVNSETFDHAKAARNGAVRHHPHEHVQRLRRERNEIVKRVVRRSGLRDFVVRLRFHRVDEIGKLDRILNEEDRDVIADEIEDAFVGVKLDREAAHVARQISASRASRPRWRSGRKRASCARDR